MSLRSKNKHVLSSSLQTKKAISSGRLKITFPQELHKERIGPTVVNGLSRLTEQLQKGQVSVIGWCPAVDYLVQSVTNIIQRDHLCYP